MHQSQSVGQKKIESVFEHDHLCRYFTIMR